MAHFGSLWIDPRQPSSEASETREVSETRYYTGVYIIFRVSAKIVTLVESGRVVSGPRQAASPQAQPPPASCAPDELQK